MTNKGLNQNDIKIRNRSKVLRILRSNKGISRKDISDQMGLSKAAISSIISEMIAEKLIVELGSQETGIIGRNKVLLELNRNFGCVLGLSISTNSLTLCIANIIGEPIDKYFYEFPEETEYNNNMIASLIVEKALYMMWDNGIDRNTVLGLGIGYIGDVKTVDIEFIENHLADTLKVPVISDNNVKALAMYQMDFSTVDATNDFLFVKYGPGLGMSIVQNGTIVEGSNHRAGEIGHTIVDINANTSCRCGRKGCLESLISEKGIVEDLEKLGTDYKHLIINKHLALIDYLGIDELLEKGNESIRSIFEKRYDYLAKSLANAIILFDPNILYLYGSIFSQTNLYNMIINRVDVYLGINSKTVIKLSDVNPDNAAIGPTALALRYKFYNVGGYKDVGI